VPYSAELFDYAGALGFAGFRIHAPINRPDFYDEVCVFPGASYLRAKAKGQVYGLSARGLQSAPATRRARSLPASPRSGSSDRSKA
jgi:glucans biosynthesis protein